MKSNILVILDLEVPLVYNDNAFELMEASAKKGGLGKGTGSEFFEKISRIDDIWGLFSGIVKDIDPEYSPGGTLKVILPFIKAMGVTTEWMYNFSKKNIKLVDNAKEALAMLEKYNPWIISNSFFIKAFCNKVGFDFLKTYSTKVNSFDNVLMNFPEMVELTRFVQEVAGMPLIEYNKETGEISPEHQEFYDRITDFIWQEVYNMDAGVFLKEVHPVGAKQKKEAMDEILRNTGFSSDNVLYVGDSITDLECVKEAGLSLMINGKGPAFYNSDIAYIGKDARAISEIADVFSADGKKGVIGYCYPHRASKYGGFFTAIPKNPAEAKELEKKSIRQRNELRGAAQAQLS